MNTNKKIHIISLSLLALISYLAFKPDFTIELLAAQLEVLPSEESTESTEEKHEEQDDNEIKEPQDEIKTEKQLWQESLQDQLAFHKTTAVDEDGKNIVTNYDSIYVLVNKERALPSYYEPEDLVIPNVPFPFKDDLPRKYMREDAAEALELLFDVAAENKLALFATSGYRSYQTQKSIFQQRAAAVGEEEANRLSARPGESEHQTGLAMDVTSPQVGYRLTSDFGKTKEGIWLAENVHHYGFIIRYPKDKEHITGYSYEPWHLRYVGERLATYLYENSLTLEEYFIQEHDY